MTPISLFDLLLAFRFLKMVVKISASPTDIRIKRIDHLGLVAGICKELKIAEIIDTIIPKNNYHHVSYGQAFVAMLLNGLGFHSRTLHMMPQYFENLPTERLIGSGVLPEHLNDDVLGRCLDMLYEYDVSSLYQVMAEQVVDKLKLKSKALHIDITSFHVDGDYQFDEEEPDDQKTKLLKLVKGYSRDHRPDLNQVILKLVCENEAGIPVYMKAMDGNTNDQKAFADFTRQHIKSLKSAQESRYFIGDAALYTSDTIKNLHEQNTYFVTRVPMKLKECKTLLKSLEEMSFLPMEKGYEGHWIDENYAEVPQKWLVLRSEQAVKRENHTFQKNLLKNSEKEIKAFQKLCKTSFACEDDALKAFTKFQKTLKLIDIESPSCAAVQIHKSAGRPKKNQIADSFEYYLAGNAFINLEKIKMLKAQLGIFILATNDCDTTPSMDELLEIYKSQQNVERGFRFLKSPEFLTSSIFLKKPERIEALLMVMTTCLMIYAAIEHRIKQSLKKYNAYIPDMKKKGTQNPTARWVFHCFNGIDELSLSNNSPLITGIKDHQATVINVLGENYAEIYS